MHFKEGYRLFSAVDFMFSSLLFILWENFHITSKGLVRLQFEKHLEDSPHALEAYRANVISVGSRTNAQIAVKMLESLWGMVAEDCKSSNNGHRDLVKNAEEIEYDILQGLAFTIYAIFLGLAGNLVLDFISIVSTRQERTSAPSLILLLLVFQILFFIGYSTAAISLKYDFKYCATTSELNPMLTIFAVAMFYKPIQFYVMGLYYKDVQQGRRYVPDDDFNNDDSCQPEGQQCGRTNQENSNGRSYIHRPINCTDFTKDGFKNTTSDHFNENV